MTRPGPSLLQLQADVQARAEQAGLQLPEIVYEVVDHRRLNEIAAYGGFPVRYPHWRFGMEYDRLIKGHAYGLQKIYELVVNTRPVVAYLLSQNAPVEQKLVMAHVCGHADFFAHNAWFAHTEGDMMDRLASHGTRLRVLSDEVGVDAVEDFVDLVQGLDNLVDAGALGRAVDHAGNAPPLDGEATERDLLGHLLLHAPLLDWQHEVLAILRDEAYYFLPQGLTKIMNEGWASFWHSRLMTSELLRDAEVVDYAEQHSGAMGGSDGPMNPYKLGIELFRELFLRGGGERGGGLDAIFEARTIHNDLTFVDAHLDLDFARAHRLGDTDEQCAQAREQLLASLTNGGQPVIRRVAPRERGELSLSHSWSGSELQIDVAGETLVNLGRLWRAPVSLVTRLEGRELLLLCVDGEIRREFGELLERPAELGSSA
ncbi:MAG: stage V sporulation protein R [Planctomycetota bacterium]|nr:MAG: stage V sporulation protein R [Planctomycetota bacterium]